MGWKLQLDKYQGVNVFPAKGCVQWVWRVATEMFSVNRYFLGIKPADCKILPKKHQHTCLKSIVITNYEPKAWAVYSKSGTKVKMAR